MTHPTEIELENYLLGRLTGPRPEDDHDTEIAAVEEHLLACGVCLDWVQVQEQIVHIMRECLLWPVAKRTRKAKVMTANQGWLF